ncbi:MAG: hypothetical protein OQK32_00565 [Gammaproteobacteria bacterium]|nr:hypothetical protein [Gammaproteobacteria bacterium]MCW8922415.1 hypothetical protein [Gammaproteobacteria bacterium]
MKIRVKSRWNDKGRERSAEEIGSALGFNLWRIAGANVLHLENEGFQTDTYNQRLDVIAELLGFFVHVVDRMTSEKEYPEDDRRALITALALNLAKTMHDNRLDTNEDKDADYKGQFIQTINERMGEYAGFAYDGNEPGFQMKRRCGEHVTEVMGEKDKKWVTEQIMSIEIPDALKTFKKVARDLI